MAAKPSRSIDTEIAAAEKALAKSIRTLAKLKQKAQPREVEDAEFATAGGRPVRLSALFGDKDELILVHNMGRTCPYCTLWADGFNGLAPHLENRAAFVLATPDDPATQAELARSRGWRFRMVSDAGARFSTSVGFGEDGGMNPGVTTYRKRKDGVVERIASASFGPGDIYNPAFHLFDLLKGGTGTWSPKFKYGRD